MNRLRAVTIGAITALVAAVLGLLVEFGVGLSDTQKESILVVIAALGPILVGLLDSLTDRHYPEDRYDRTRPGTGPAGSGSTRA